MRFPALLAAAISLAGLSLYACSSDSGSGGSGDAGAESGASSSSSSSSSASSSSSTSSTSSTSTSSSSSGDSGSDARETGPRDTGVDAKDPELNGCTVYEDHTGAADPRTIDWDFDIIASPGACLKIKVGQTVTWVADPDLAAHPLAASGGDTPTPIPAFDAVSGVVTFNTAGTFGYICANHGTMIGAIRVVP